MIELSKCPTCAAEDRVTIAGKEFCMRCGTPAEDNAMIEAAGVTQQQSGAVSKFAQNPPPTAENTPSMPTEAQEPAASPTVIEQPPAHIENTSNVANQATQQPSPAAIQQPQSSPAELDQRIQELSAQPTALATQPPAQQPAIEPVPPTPPTILPNAASTPQPGVIATTMPATEVQPVLSPDPKPQSIPAATNPAIDAISAPNTKISNTMPGADAVMSLDKHEPGVFSDEELHELNNTTIEPLQATDSPKLQPATDQAAVSAPQPNPIASNDPYATQSPQASPAFSAAPFAATSNSMPPSTATGSSQPSKSTAKKILKPAGVVVSIAIIFATGAYLWKLNFPNLAFKIASSKAGINATMPGYVPDGYTLKGSIQTTPGSVSYSLVNADNKIAVSQSKTDWDSQALAENYVSPKAENYLAIQAQGLTIYMMGNNQASWVNKGTWYRIESPNQPLTQEQVIKMATSL